MITVSEALAAKTVTSAALAAAEDRFAETRSDDEWGAVKVAAGRDHEAEVLLRAATRAATKIATTTQKERE